MQKKSKMKKKLRFISYLLITVSLFILINLVYCYNNRTDNFDELNKEIFISLLNLIIGFIFFFKSKKSQDEK
ncbi:hypothetical protein MYRA21_3310 [Myroides sp. A21]|nr:hypothetical protein MYRA21_3310 [Myroides sp. A21]